MALTLVNLSGYQRGVEAEETGINVESFSCRYFPEVKDKLKGITGETKGFAVSTVPSRDVKIRGEVKGSTGLMAATFVTAITPGNDVAVFASATGGLYLDEVTEGQNRDGWRDADFSLSSDPLCA